MAGVLPSDESSADVGGLRPGTRLGRYELLVPIAHGGMARVWAARQHGQRGFQKLVAIKTILPHLAEEAEFERMFLDEARIASSIHHPNVCEIYELGDDNKTLYLAMEWVSGDSLSRLLRSVGEAEAIDPRVVARMLADACAGVHAAHEQVDEEGRELGIVHRDLSPHNVLFTIDGITKVCDFGVAKALGQLHAQTSAGQLKGKISYMSPEQVTGAPTDRRSDVFSLGCVLYEATTGRRPFKGERDHQIMYAIMNDEVAPPSSVVANYPPELERVVMHALAREPLLRYATAERMRFALEEFLARGSLVTQANVAEVVRARLGEPIERRRQQIKQASSTAEQAGRTPSVPPTRDGVDFRSGVKVSRARESNSPPPRASTPPPPATASPRASTPPPVPRASSESPPPVQRPSAAPPAPRASTPPPVPRPSSAPPAVPRASTAPPRASSAPPAVPRASTAPPAPPRASGEPPRESVPPRAPSVPPPAVEASREGGVLSVDPTEPIRSDAGVRDDDRTHGSLTLVDVSTVAEMVDAPSSPERSDRHRTIPPARSDGMSTDSAPPIARGSIPPSAMSNVPARLTVDESGNSRRFDVAAERTTGAGHYAIAASIGLALAAVIGGAGFFFWRLHVVKETSEPPSAMSTWSAPESVVASSATSPAATPDIVFRIVPPDANLVVDGRELPSGAWTIPRPAVGETISVVVRAKGHEDAHLQIDYFSSSSMAVSLSPIFEISEPSGPDASSPSFSSSSSPLQTPVKPERKARASEPKALPDNPY